MAAPALSSVASGETSEMALQPPFTLGLFLNSARESSPQDRLRAMLLAATQLEASIRHTRELVATLLE